MNDRLEIASRFMTALIASGSQSYLKTEAGNQCLAYADALIAAEASTSEIPTSHSANVPSVEEMRIALNIEMGYDFSGKTLSDIHQWLTERAKSSCTQDHQSMVFAFDLIMDELKAIHKKEWGFAAQDVWFRIEGKIQELRNHYTERAKG